MVTPMYVNNSEFCHALLFTWIPPLIITIACIKPVNVILTVSPQVCIWDISSFKPVQSVKVSSSVLALDVWSHYLAIGSSVVQMVDMSSDELRRILFVEDSEGIPVCGHLQHIFTKLFYDFIKAFTFSYFYLSSLFFYTVLVINLFTVILRAPHCPHILLHLLVRKVTWSQQGLTALW